MGEFCSLVVSGLNVAWFAVEQIGGRAWDRSFLLKE